MHKQDIGCKYTLTLTVTSKLHILATYPRVAVLQATTCFSLTSAMPSPTTQLLAVSWPRQTTTQAPPVLMFPRNLYTRQLTPSTTPLFGFALCSQIDGRNYPRAIRCTDNILPLVSLCMHTDTHRHTNAPAIPPGPLCIPTVAPSHITPIKMTHTTYLPHPGFCFILYILHWQETARPSVCARQVGVQSSGIFVLRQ